MRTFSLRHNTLGYLEQLCYSSGAESVGVCDARLRLEVIKQQ